jgi:hypothetical protein
MEIVFDKYRDSFGYNTFKSFLEHVSCYQTVNQILTSKNPVTFKFVEGGIPIYDIFEFMNNKNVEFKSCNIIVVETLRQFKEIVSNLDFSKKYIIVSESFWDTEKFTWDGLDYQLVYVPWDIFDFQARLTNRSNLYFHLMDIDLLNKYKPKYDFLCLAGRSKKWRDKFIKELSSKINLSNSLVSYHGKILGSNDLLNIDLEYNRENKKDFETQFYSPIRINGHHYSLSYFTKNELFQLTNFSVIVETESELPEYHVTEKTLKCLIFGHPFVVIGTPEYLKFLKQMGFQTYGDFIDESYDSIIDFDHRKNRVVEIIGEIIDKKFDVNKLKKIQEHNLLNLITLRHTNLYDNFLNSINECNCNKPNNKV